MNPNSAAVQRDAAGAGDWIQETGDHQLAQAQLDRGSNIHDRALTLSKWGEGQVTKAPMS